MPYIHQSEAWGRSIFPPAPVINGVQCLPLSIGHIALLGLLEVVPRLQNFETSGGALVEGLTICSQSFEDSVYSINKGPEAWQSVVNEVGEHAFKMPVTPGIKSFSEYLESSQDVPVYWQKQSGGSNKTGSETWMTIKTVLQQRLHLSESEIMNRPVSQCIAEYFTIAESEGWLTMQNKQEADLLASDAHKEAEKFAIEFAKKVRAANG